MGSLFSTPKEPDLPPAPKTESAEELAARRRRGLAQTIRTSGRGLLAAAGPGPAGKSLLGE